MRNLQDRTGLPQIEADMRFMCETVGNRLAGSPEEERVADCMAERLRALGLTNVEKLPFACKRWKPGHAELARLDPAGTPVAAQHNTHTPATPPGGLEGELVLFEPVDWEGGPRRTDLGGKIGLFLGGYGESANVFRELHESALAALVFVDTRMQTDWPIANGVGEKFMALVRKPMAYISLMDAWALARDGVRRVRLVCTGTAEDGTSWNVTGDLPGSQPAGRVIVVSGHIDSVAVGVGADDNATGIAATLECARRLQAGRHRATFRFIGFGAEEQLSVGSTRYVKEQVKDLDRIKFVCNFDGIGAHFGHSTVMSTGTPALDAYVREIVDERRQWGVVQVDACPFQDQFWFTAKGIPGLWFTRKTHAPGYWYHHSVHNNLDAVSLEQVAWTAEVACDLLADLGDRQTWPFPRRIAPALRQKIDAWRTALFD